jgi:hypothetical protein
MQGSQIGLHAFGRQDQELFDPKNVHKIGNFTFDQCSHFTKVHRHYDAFTNGSSRWPFGDTVVFKLNPQTMGDLLVNAHLKVEFSNIYKLVDYSYTYDPEMKYSTCPFLGVNMIDTIEFKVNDQLIDRNDTIGLAEKFGNLSQNRLASYAPVTNGDCQTSFELYESNFMNFVCNFGISILKNENDYFTKGMTSFNFEDGLSYYTDLMLHFSNDYKEGKPVNYFPLCAVYNQDVYLYIKFNKQEWFTNSPWDVTVPKITLVTEEIILDPYEKQYISRVPFDMPITITEPQVKMDIDNSCDVKSAVGTSSKNTSPNFIKVDLNSGIPLKYITWALIKRDYTLLDFNMSGSNGPEQFKTIKFMNRGNCSNHENKWFNRYNTIELDKNSNTYIQQQIFAPLISECYISTSKLDIGGFAKSTDFKDQYGAMFFRGFQAARKEVPFPLINLYRYCFDEVGTDKLPSGFENYTIMDKSVKHTLNINLIDSDVIKNNVYVLYVYNTGLKNLHFEDGFVTVTSYS